MTTVIDIAVRRISAILFFGGLLILSGSVSGASTPLFTKTDVCPIPPDKPKVIACAGVSIDVAALISSTVTELIIKLPDQGNVSFSRIVLEKVRDKQYVWRGKAKGPSNYAVLAVVNNTVVGTVTFYDHMYRLRLVKGGATVFELLDRKYFGVREPPAGAAIALDAEADPTCVVVDPPQCATDSPRKIDVLVVYSQAALNAAETLDALTGWVDHAASDANTSYTNSGIPLQLNILYPWFSMVESSFQEAGVAEDLKALKDDCGELRKVHDLRDETKADAVVLITHIAGQSGGGGEGETMLPYELAYNAFQSEAFAVVQIDEVMTQNFVFAHELGHIMGAQHEGTDAGAFPFSHGHIDLTPTTPCGPWGTIMTASSCCSIKRYWSSPGMNVDSCWEPMGNTTTEFNAETLRRSALTVANFRCASPTPSNVWIKDGWNDTGQEPDPAMANSAMYLSPYIWVRNSRDPAPSFMEAHQHQNPVVKGLNEEPNYIYVKVHNSFPAATNGGSATGKLEVMVADGSTALSMADFSVVNPDDGETNLMNGSTTIFEIPWKPSHAGHYCLIARWNSATDPINADPTGSIGAYVRNSNNVAWRNMNVVDLGPSQDSDTAEFFVGNLEQQENRFTLAIKPADPERGFFEFGQVFFTMDSILMAGWKKAKFASTGILVADETIWVTDRNGGTIDLILGPKAKGKVKMTFSRKKAKDSYLRGTFVIDVRQTGKNGLIGGITYEVRTITPAGQK